MFKGALLDVDGVLILSEPTYHEAVRRTFGRYGIDIDEAEYVRRWMIEQTGSSGVIRDYGLRVELGEIRAIKNEIVERLVAEQVEMMPHAMELLDLLGSRPMGIVTSAARHEMERQLRKVGILDRFRVSVAIEDVSAGKSKSSEPYEKGSRLLGIDPHEIIVVEDNPVGVRSAKGAGCVVVAYPNGYTARLDFTGADATVANLAEVDDSMLAVLYEKSRNHG